MMTRAVQHVYRHAFAFRMLQSSIGHTVLRKAHQPAARLRSSLTAETSALRPRPLARAIAREYSSTSATLSNTDSDPLQDTIAEVQVPTYDMTFTCRPCKTRSTHRVSKQAYFHGTVLITCPGCKNRHLISDHLKIFSDKRVTLEDIMKEKGELVKKGALDTEGDIEFWPTEEGELGKLGN